MKARNPGLIIFAITATLFLGYVASVFLHQEKPVNYGQDLEKLKNRGVPDFKLSLVTLRPPIRITDEVLGNTDLHANITIINFWASWCAPCVKELPSLIELSRRYSRDPRLELIGVSEDKNLHELVRFMEGFQSLLGTTDLNFKFLWDGNFDVAYRFGSQKIPETYIVGKDHKLIRKVIDEQNWVSPDFLKWLNGLLDGASS